MLPFHLAKVVDGGEHLFWTAIQIRPSDELPESCTTLWKTSLPDGIGRGFEGGFAGLSEVVEHHGPRPLFLEFRNAFFDVFDRTGDFDVKVASGDVHKTVAHRPERASQPT